MLRKIGIIFVLSTILLSSNPSFLYPIANGQSEISTRNRVVIIAPPDSKDAAEYSNVFSIIGLPTSVEDYQDLNLIDWSTIKLLVIPGASARFIGDNTSKILSELANGMMLYSEQESALTKRIGLVFRNEFISVSRMVDINHEDIEIRWPNWQSVSPITNSNLKIYAKDFDSGLPLVAGGTYKTGKYIYSAVELGKAGQRGYESVPFLHEYIKDWLSLESSSNRPRLSVFLDWGYYYNQNPFTLADRLKSYGVTAVHLSAWYEPDQISTFSANFIDACHSLGISVYAWFQLPMITKSFWDDNPQWREKTGENLDAYVNWRYLMALQDPDCMESAQMELRKVISNYNWDGVNFSGLYFESPMGFSTPGDFTPMSLSFRNQFKVVYGYDPLLLFNKESPYYYKNDKEHLDQLIEFRTQTLEKITSRLLSFVKSLENNSLLDIQITQLDSFYGDNIKQNTGVASDSYLRLQSEYNFTYRIEDSFLKWGNGIERFGKVSTHFREGYSKPYSTGFSFNLFERDFITGTTKQQTGLPLLAVLYEANKHADSISIKNLSSTYDHDLKRISGVLSGTTSLIPLSDNSWRTRNDRTVMYPIQTDKKNFLLDHKPWPFVGVNNVWVPAGGHQVDYLESFNQSYSNLRITDVNFELIDGSLTSEGAFFSYRTDKSTYITVNELPYIINVDDQQFIPEQIFYTKGNFTFKLPQGEHTIELITTGRTSKDIQQTVNRKLISLSTPVTVINEEFYIPVNELLEKIGAKFEWDVENESVSAEYEGHVLWLQNNNPIGRANGSSIELVSNPSMKEGKLIGSLTFIAEAFNMEIQWDKDNRIVEISWR
ncbi:MAG: hypothetical protein K0S39_1649 [Paenibacillus sp.]|nr:hypothetical protein [Paenibacillus sp.]